MTDSESRRFVKSTWSGGNGGDCVEWAVAPYGVHVRDSKDRSGPELFFTFAEWADLSAKAAGNGTHDAISVVHEGVRLTGRGGELFFTRAEWRAFVAGARTGECDVAMDTAS
jgi:hypothetical protein